MLLLLICIVGTFVGYYGAHYATIAFFNVRTALKNRKFKVQKGAYTV